MSKTLPVLLHPHKILKTKATPVAKVTPEIVEKLDQMLATLYRADGVGLAANQVGFTDRLVVIDVGVVGADGKRDYSVRNPIFMVNPEIVGESDDRILHQEGCLSLPQVWADVERAAEIDVKYLDRDGKEHTLHAAELLAICVQHEIDHLDGILFVERLSRLKRDMSLKKWGKIRKDILEFGEKFDVLAEEKGVIPAAKEL